MLITENEVEVSDGIHRSTVIEMNLEKDLDELEVGRFFFFNYTSEIGPIFKLCKVTFMYYYYTYFSIYNQAVHRTNFDSVNKISSFFDKEKMMISDKV